MAGAIIAFLYFLLLCLFPHFRGSMGNNNSTDQLGLLSFKSMLSSDPSCILASWNTSRHFCSWPGVVCGRRHPERVVALLMGSSNLSGHISPFLGNLSFLKELDLSGNQLVGRVPTELGQLARLQFLNVSANHLEGSIPMTLGECTKLNELDLSNNKFQGEIPNEIGTLVNLVLIDFGNNGLSGEIPRSLADLRSIKYLSLRSNRLFGEIPSSWGNLSNLNLLSVRFNMLSGPIPSSLGVLSSLSLLSFAGNNLSGLIPATLWNISSLTAVSFQENMFTGTIPPNAFYNVPRLQKLYMDTNQFYGPIPSSISNASDMIQVQLNMNFFNGVIPPEVGSLRKLKWLQLSDNSFQTKQPKDWEFLTTLTNCSQLQVLGLGSNKFMGTLPDSFSNLSSSLTDLFLDTNALSGSIPKDIGNLINLQTLYLDTNFFTGSLPPSLCMLKNLVELYIYYNNITGSIPLAIGNLTRLEHLALFENSFSGTIPSTLGNLTELSKLGLQRNYLTGLIPRAIFNIPGLSNILDLSHNLLEGSLPQEIGNLKNLDEFNAESNSLSGDIPTTIGECQLLRYLYLQNNTFNGSIPSVLSQMKGLEILDLSSNNFSGKIPKFLGNLPYLDYLNLSFNNFTGEVPNFGIFANSTAISIHGNGELCGGIPDLHLPTCSLQLPKMKHKFLVIPIVTFLVATLIILPLLCKLLIWHKKIKTKFLSTTPIQGHLLITYSQLVRATDGFSAANLLGSGSFGLVYKGELNGQEGESTILVAVKVLKLETPKALKSFTAECEVLRNMQHRNLVKIITICSSLDSRGNDFKAIVYDFMANGSLEGWLHPDTNDQVEQRYLSLLQRVSILIDVAFALDYLHCHGPEPVAHCDLKPSNILLDADMVAHVGDFGLAKILVDGCSIVQPSTSSMGFIGTIGYAAPEYGAGNVVSTKGDIYSYGVIVLEMVTGKRPADSTLGQGMSLREYVELSLYNSTMDIVDMSLFLCPENEIQDASDSSHEGRIGCLMSLLRLGLSCTEDVASSRISTGDIIKELLAIKGDLL